MRRTSTILALVAMAMLLGTLTALAAGSGPGYLQATSFSTQTHGKHVTLSVTTSGAIPTRSDGFVDANIAVGLAWADLDSGKVVVAAIHPTFRDSRQHPYGWHVHTATLAGGATGPNDFCLASLDSDPHAAIRIHGDMLTIKIKSDDLPVTPEAFDGAVGFTLQSDPACGSGLAVRIVEGV